MSNVKFTQLPNQGAPTDATIIPTVASGTNYTVTAANLKTYVNSTTGNVTAAYFIGDGSQLTGLPANYGNANVSNYLASGTNLANVVTQANVSAAYLIGDGSAVTNLNLAPGLTTYTGNITGGNISVTGQVIGNIRNATGGYSDSNVQGVLQSYTGSFTAQTVSTTGNITAPYFVGNGSALTGITASLGGTMSSNIAGAGYSITGLGNLTAANVTGTHFGSGANLTNIPTSIVAGTGISINQSTGAVTITNNNPTPYTNANVAAYLPTYTGVVGAGSVSATGNITGSNVVGTHYGNGATLSNVVTSIVAGSGISVNAATGAVTITATGGGGASISTGNTFVNTNGTGGLGGTGILWLGKNVDVSTKNIASNSIIIQQNTGSINSSITLSPDGNINMSANGFSGSYNISGANVLIGSNLVVSGATTTVNSLAIGGGAVPTATSPGTQGQIYWNTVSGTTYLYVCIATNTWRRVALSFW